MRHFRKKSSKKIFPRGAPRECFPGPRPLWLSTFLRVWMRRRRRRCCTTRCNCSPLRWPSSRDPVTCGRRHCLAPSRVPGPTAAVSATSYERYGYTASSSSLHRHLACSAAQISPQCSSYTTLTTRQKLIAAQIIKPNYDIIFRNCNIATVGRLNG